MLRMNILSNCAFNIQVFYKITHVRKRCLQLKAQIIFDSYNKIMKRPSNLALFRVMALILCLVFTQQAVFILNNGCKTYNSQGTCTTCSTSYYLDANYICQPVNPNCNTYNPSSGDCLSCYPGFGLIEGTCLPGIVSNNFEPNCNTFNGSLCVKCSANYFLNSNGKCQSVDPSCKTFDPSSGACTSCYPGFAVLNTSCVISAGAETIANCNQIDPISGKCVKCAYNYYFDAFGNCIQIDPNCKTFDTNLFVCNACYPGYNLSNALLCVKSADPAGDPNCANYDSNNQCILCSKGAIFNIYNVCIIINPSCQTYNNSNGNCLSCYPGFELSSDNTSCIVSASTPSSNIYCSKWNGTVCQTCSAGSFFDSNGNCVLADPSCKNYSDIICFQCYSGYTLTNNVCVNSTTQPNSNTLCASWNGTTCILCSKGSYMNDGICLVSNPLCMTFDLSNGNCLTCYQGFVLQQGNCAQSNITAVIDPYCLNFNSQNACLNCSAMYYIGSQGLCVEVNPLCKTYDQTYGSCITCFSGFALTQGQCTISTQNLTDPNCAQFMDEICLACSSGYIFGSDGLCGLVSVNCKSFDQISGYCLSCFLGFSLINGNCIEGNSTNNGVDPNCASFAAGICIRCSSKYYFGPQGNCLAVDPLCSTFDPSNGNCLTCYQSYVISNGICILGNSSTTDPNCASWLNNVCTSCAKRTFLSANSSCQPVNINCNTYDSNSGLCTSCYSGFSISNGQCSQATSPNSCSEFDSLANCVKCSSNSYLSNGQCIAIDPQCASFNLTSLTCSNCYSGYSILNGACQISSVSSQYAINNCFAYDQNNQCISCYDRYFLSANSCQLVNVFCKTYDGTNGNCLTCYTSFTLSNGNCAQ